MIIQPSSWRVLREEMGNVWNLFEAHQMKIYMCEDSGVNRQLSSVGLSVIICV